MKDALVIILYDHPREHTTDYAQQTAEHLAQRNTVVCYKENGAKSVKEIVLGGCWYRIWEKYKNNLYFYTPVYIIPFRRFEWVVSVNHWINIFLLKLILYWLATQRAFTEKIVWLFYPEYGSVIQELGSSYVSVYDCIDYQTGFSPSRERRANMKKWERQLIKQCSYFFVNSHVLYAIHKKVRKDIQMVPQGFRVDAFQNIHRRTKQFYGIAERPIIGYIGGINYRLDYTLLIKLIQKTPQYVYLFVGPIQENDREYFRKHVKHNIENLFSLPNVRHIDALSKAEIPSVLSLFDVAIIPYDTTFTFNRYCYPMKLFEYFYMGKPVISTPVEELKRFPQYVKIGNTVELWKKHITSFLSHPWPKLYQKEQRKLAQENSWDGKMSKIYELLG